VLYNLVKSLIRALRR